MGLEKWGCQGSSELVSWELLLLASQYQPATGHSGSPSIQGSGHCRVGERQFPKGWGFLAEEWWRMGG